MGMDSEIHEGEYGSAVNFFTTEDLTTYQK